MPKFLVHVCDARTLYRAKYIEAASEEDAQELAEQEDWRTWPADEDNEDSVNSYIDWIEEVGTE